MSVHLYFHRHIELVSPAFFSCVGSFGRFEILVGWTYRCFVSSRHRTETYNIDMEPVGALTNRLGACGPQSCKVGAQYRRGNNGWGSHSWGRGSTAILVLVRLGRGEGFLWSVWACGRGGNRKGKRERKYMGCEEDENRCKRCARTLYQLQWVKSRQGT